MKREFYIEVDKKLKANEDVFVATIIKSNNDEKVGIKSLNIDNDFVVEEGEEIVIEKITSKPHLVICGGGHISLSLCSIMKMLEFNITIIDDREEFASRTRFPLADNIICGDFEQAMESIEVNDNLYYVIVTRGHKADQICLEKALKSKYKYLGMIGSKGKVANAIKQLREKGYAEEIISDVHAPIGLNIGAQTPSEIAVSIAAQIIEEKYNENIFNVDEQILNSIINKEGKKVLVTILDKRGSSPRGVGASMLIFEDRSFIGTIGGGAVENAAYQKAIELLEQEKSLVETYDLSNSNAAKLGMACGGTIKVLLEYIY